MESQKSRGLKHIKDKTKYRDKSNKTSKSVLSKSQPNLESNWHRYIDGDDTENEVDLMKFSDYSNLADVPIIKGTQFQTKSDKLLTNETVITSFDDCFTLNIEKLEDNLMTLPFYKRVGIDKKYFSNIEIDDMNRESEYYLEKYIKQNKSETYRSLFKQRPISIDIDSMKSKDVLKSKPMQDIAISIQANLILEETTPSKTKNSDTSVKNSEELEEWLDNFLNT